MGENLNPLDELKNLDRQVDRVSVLEDLKPIFFRLDEIAKANDHDFEVQLVVGDIKQHLVNRGTKLKEQATRSAASAAAAIEKPAPGAAAIPPPIPPPPPQSTPPAPSGSAATTGAKPRSPLDGPASPAPPTPLPMGAEPPDPRIVRPHQDAQQAQEAHPPQPPAGATPPFPGPVAPPPTPKPPSGTSSIPSPTIGRPQSPEPPGPQAIPAPPGAGPVTKGPQKPPGVGAALPAGPPGQPPKPPSKPSSRPVPQVGSAPPKAKAQPSMNWKRPLMAGALLGALAAVVGIAFLVNLSRKHNRLFEQKQTAEGAGVQVQISTTPPNASVRVNGETKCTAPCAVALPPGSYQVTAFLDGYDPATSALSVAAGQPGTVTFTLTPQAQAVRILTDLDQGKVAFDDQPPADLQEGQFILDNVAPGSHTIKVNGKSGDAMFTFDIAEAKPPVVTGAIAAHNLIAVVVSSLGKQARVVTNSGPLKLAVNGQAEDDAGPAGIDLKAFQPGVDELVIGDGKDQRNMKESFGPAPMLTAFLKSDLNIGTLIVSTGEDDVRVYLNDKEYRRRTQRGQLRIPAIGSVKVAVYKDGFQIEPAQTADVKKGGEVRLEFKLKAIPVVTTLQIRGGTPGAEVFIDQSSVGTVGADGTFANNSVAPGDHVIELRRDQYTPKRLQRNFRAGQAVALTGADVTLAAAAPANATIRIARTPANAAITYHRADESESREMRAPQVELPPGSYVFSAKAPGYTDRTERVQVAAGESRSIEMALTLARPTAPAPKNGDVTDFEEAGAWKKDGDLWVHKGGGFVPYKLGPAGVYTFTVELVKGGGVFRGGRIRWAVQYVDAKNYLLYEMDRKTFWANVVEKGKKLERQKTPLQLDNGKTFTIQLEITQDHAVHKLKTGDTWLTLDSFAEPGRNFTAGKFGFLIQGNDEIGITDFTFTPK